MRAPAAQLRFLRRREISRTAPVDGRPTPREEAGDATGRSRPMWPVLLGCMGVAALTLLLPSTPTYDPWAWIVWGRDITQLDLNTHGGPSWKPLPILFTTPFSLLGNDAAPYLWIWISRAAGLFACAMAYRVASRVVGGAYGAVAGVAAALALFSSFKFVRDAALGNSEALLAALVLWAFERHLDGRRDHALYLGFAAALLRPEVWPFLGLYGLWLWFREPRLRMRMVLLAPLIPALWFLPEWWGSGDPLRAGVRANNPNPGSAAFADHPSFELLKRLWAAVIAPVKGGIVVGVGYALVAWRRRRAEGPTLAILIGAVSWFGLVAVMTEAGFAGNYRYLIVTTAGLCVLGGIGVGRVLQGVEKLGERRFGTARAGAVTAAAVLVVGLGISTPFIVEKWHNTERVMGGLRHEADTWRDMKELIASIGGKEHVLGCSGVFSGPFQTQMLAHELGVHGIRIGSLETPPPGILFRNRTVPNGPLVIQPTDDRFRLVRRHGKWRMLTVAPDRRHPDHASCPLAGRGAPRAPLPPGV
jgi:hypothetical protein